MHNPIDMTGVRVGRLLVLGQEPGRMNGLAVWRCRCDCGRETVIRGASLRGPRPTRSCGCLSDEALVRRSLRHGCGRPGRRDPTYVSWCSMNTRCYDANATRYDRYGGRGITVCERWRTSFKNFLADMGPRPPGTTLDRIDVNGNYEPGNCRWATTKTQARNTRHTRLTESLAGRIRSMRASGRGVRSIGRELGIGHDQVSRVCNGRTWAQDEVVLDPGQGVGG